VGARVGTAEGAIITSDCPTYSVTATVSSSAGRPGVCTALHASPEIVRSVCWYVSAERMHWVLW